MNRRGEVSREQPVASPVARPGAPLRPAPGRGGWHRQGATAGGATYRLNPDVNQVSCVTAFWDTRIVGRRLDTEAQRKTNGKECKSNQPGKPQQVTPFQEGPRTEIILLGHGSALRLYSIFGALLECFQDHHDTITSIWVVNMPLPLLQTFLHCLLCML
ncbi:LOW QUALITY PROTEIN: uncharacterized protein O9250_006086 [Rhynochetos jubatus]